MQAWCSIFVLVVLACVARASTGANPGWPSDVRAHAWVGWRAVDDTRPLEWFPWVAEWRDLGPGGSFEPSPAPGEVHLVVHPSDAFSFGGGVGSFESRVDLEASDGWLPVLGRPEQAKRVWGLEGNAPSTRPGLWVAGDAVGPLRACPTGGSSPSPSVRWALQQAPSWGWGGANAERPTLVVSMGTIPPNMALVVVTAPMLQRLSTEGLEGWDVRWMLWVPKWVDRLGLAGSADQVPEEVRATWEV